MGTSCKGLSAPPMVRDGLPCGGNLAFSEDCHAPNCGCPYEQQEEDYHWKCNECGTKFVSSYSKCPRCGSRNSDYA